jgi:putative endonuclease
MIKGVKMNHETESKNSTRLEGQKGEEIARKYLSEKGYRIVEQNWKTRRGEVDLIVSKKETLYFVEVKFRRSQGYGSGEDAIRPWKQQKMVQAVLGYLQRKRIQNVDIRLAALIIQQTPEASSIEFFEFPLDLPTRYY